MEQNTALFIDGDNINVNNIKFAQTGSEYTKKLNQIINF